MRAAVKRDHHARTITIQVDPGSVPDVDVTRSYHRKPRIFRPDIVTINVSDGEIQTVTAAGGLVLKSGAASTEVRESEKWYSGTWSSPKIGSAPEWLATLIREAPEGVTAWRDLDTANPEEVQAL
jgi:hypothetical protein